MASTCTWPGVTTATSSPTSCGRTAATTRTRISPSSDQRPGEGASRPLSPSGERARERGVGGLDGDPLERLRVLVAALLAHVPVALAHELLDVPLATGLRELALVLAQRLDLSIQGRGDVDEVV